MELLHCWALIGGEDHSVAIPALLCHKEPAQGTQSPHWGALGRNTPIGGYFLPFAGSLWHKGGFHARKGPIIGALMP